MKKHIGNVMNFIRMNMMQMVQLLFLIVCGSCMIERWNCFSMVTNAIGVILFLFVSIGICLEVFWNYSGANNLLDFANSWLKDRVGDGRIDGDGH